MAVKLDTLEALTERLDSLARKRGAEWGLKLDIASECCWGAELRWTAEPHRPDGPDRSIVFWSTADLSPEDAVSRAYMDLLDYLENA